MDTERWERIEEVFNNALILDADKREEYLAEVCFDDVGLRTEVESLISSHEDDSTFLQGPALEMGLKVLATGATRFSVGESIGPYQLLSILGRGGMGTVYLALDPRLGRKIALKVLAPSVTKDRERSQRFRQEARVASKISHPNLASIYEVGEFKEHQFIAMEFVDGVTLRERLARGPISISDVLDIISQTGRAIEAAHAVGIVHRDIKPENIMIRNDGYVKVLDFGLAKLTEAYHRIPGQAGPDQTVTGAGGLTEPGMLMGTVTYMSPEQARGRDVDARSDLWSLGVVLYESITGTNPFLSETPSDTIAAILKTDPPLLSSLTGRRPNPIDQIVEKSLFKDRENRYQSATSFVEDLNQLRGTLERHGFTEDGSVIASGVAVGLATSPQVNRETDGALFSLETARSTVLSAFHVINHRKIAVAVVLVALLAAAAFTLKFVIYSAPHAGRSPITSLAVLPLTNANGDPGADFLSDGLSESLIDRLSRLSRLKVIARTSSFKYKTSSSAPKDIAQDLAVQGIIRGTVTKEDDNLRVKMELVDATGTTVLWSGQYNDRMSNLSALLNDISQDIATGLSLKLDAEEVKMLTRDELTSGDAYQLYLKGRYYWNQLTEESLDKSITCFNQALEIDPKYALAHAGLAASYAALGGNYRSPDVMLPQAELHAQKALDLDPQLAEAHYAKAATNQIYRWNMTETEAELRRCLELNPNYASAYSLLGSVALTRGDLNEASKNAHRALELDPLNLLFNTLLSYVYYYGRQNDRALEQMQKILKRENNAAFLYNDMAKVYAQMGLFDQALAASQRATILNGKDPDTLSSLGIVYALSGKVKDARWVAETLEKLSKEKYVQAYLIASIYGALGDKDQAFLWLAKANQQKSPQLLRFKLDPVFDKVRSDPRYDQLIKDSHLG